MILKICSALCGIHFDIEFLDKLCLFTGKSAEGKTFAFKAMDEYCRSTGMKCRYFDSTCFERSIESMKLDCIGQEIVIFDNADLYLTQELLDHALSIASTVIVSMKSYFRLNFESAGLYKVSFNSSSLSIFRIR